jgi:hypothetical protein
MQVGNDFSGRARAQNAEKCLYVQEHTTNVGAMSVLSECRNVFFWREMGEREMRGEDTKLSSSEVSPFTNRNGVTYKKTSECKVCDL